MILMNKQLKIKVIPQETVEVFSPNGSSCGKLNELEFLDLRCQIKKFKKRGFYLYYDAEKVFINKDGMLSKWIPLFTESIEMYNYLLGLK